MSKMPKWKPAPAALTERFTAALDQVPDTEPRKMFGYLAGFTHGNLFAGLYQNSVILRLPEDERAKLVRDCGAKPFEPMPGRVMRDYVQLPGDAALETKTFRSWLAAAQAYASTLPPKKKKSR